MTAQPYRPSNGTEGEGFISHFCCNCARSDHLKEGGEYDGLVGCDILGNTFSYDVDDPEYPPEWVQDESGARCTAYVPEGETLATPRCTQTVDMFGPQPEGEAA